MGKTCRRPAETGTPPSGFRGRDLRGVNGVIELEELFHPGYLHRVAYALRDANQGQTAAFLLMRNVSADQGSDSGGINVRNLGQVENQVGRSAAAHQGLKLEEIREQDRPAQADNARTAVRVRHVFDLQGLLRHCDIVLRDCEWSVKGRYIWVRIFTRSAGVGSWTESRAGVPVPHVLSQLDPALGK